MWWFEIMLKKAKSAIKNQHYQKLINMCSHYNVYLIAICVFSKSCVIQWNDCQCIGLYLMLKKAKSAIKNQQPKFYQHNDFFSFMSLGVMKKSI